MIQLNELNKGNTIPSSNCNKWIVTKATPKTITIGMMGNVTRTFAFRWDGTGFTRQGQYLYKDGIR